MDLYLLFIAAVSCIAIKIHVKGFHDAYLDKNQTSCLKGIFILIVFYSHYTGYTEVLPHDTVIYALRHILGQLMVVMFLFYSGYGMLEQSKKRKDYYLTIPKKRLLITFVNFALVVCVYGIAQRLLGNTYPVSKWLLSLIGWSSLGNSNWYIFTVLCLYLLSFAAFCLSKNQKRVVACVWVLSVLLILGQASCRPNYCYNTILAFPLGMTWSCYKGRLRQLIFHNGRYVVLLLSAAAAAAVFYQYRRENDWYFQLLSCAFAVLVVLLSVKVRLNSPVLKWFGDRLFWVYIWQRLPMLVLQHFGYDSHPYRFAAISFVVTVVLAAISSPLFKRLDNLILSALNRHHKEEEPAV